MNQVADASETSSENPNDWWGGMDRSCYLYKKESKPIEIAMDDSGVQGVVPDDHTGLVFVSRYKDGIMKLQSADLYVSGKRICNVMEFTGDVRKEYRNGKLVAKEKYFDSFKEFYRRRERDAKKERRVLLGLCILHFRFHV